MRPTYANLINKWYRPKKEYPTLWMEYVYVQRVYYDYPKVLPWDTTANKFIRVPLKYIEYQYQHEGRWIVDRRTWYYFLSHFERVEE